MQSEIMFVASRAVYGMRRREDVPPTATSLICTLFSHAASLRRADRTLKAHEGAWFDTLRSKFDLGQVNIMDAHGGQDSTDTIVDGPSSKKARCLSELLYE